MVWYTLVFGRVPLTGELKEQGELPCRMDHLRLVWPHDTENPDIFKNNLLEIYW